MAIKELLTGYARGLEIGEIQKYENLAIAPLISLNGNKSSIEYLVMPEVVNKSFIVKEKEIADVPSLYAENKSENNVLSINSQLIWGGDQDRAITRNILFEKGFIGNISVLCVEQGRWGEQSKTGFGSGGVVPREFVGSSGYSDHERQSETWDSVRDYMRETSVRSPTSSVSDVYRQKRTFLEDYRENFSIVDNQVGAVAFIIRRGKKLFDIDLFDRPRSFEKYFDHLLSCYVVRGGFDGSNKADFSREDAREAINMAELCDYNGINPKVGMGNDYELNNSEMRIRGSTIENNDEIIYANLFTLPRKGVKEDTRRTVGIETPREIRERRISERRRELESEVSITGEGEREEQAFV